MLASVTDPTARFEIFFPVVSRRAAHSAPLLMMDVGNWQREFL